MLVYLFTDTSLDFGQEFRPLLNAFVQAFPSSHFHGQCQRMSRNYCLYWFPCQPMEGGLTWLDLKQGSSAFLLRRWEWSPQAAAHSDTPAEIPGLWRSLLHPEMLLHFILMWLWHCTILQLFFLCISILKTKLGVSPKGFPLLVAVNSCILHKVQQIN